MSKPSFTPGPWLITRDSDTIGYHIRANIDGCYNQIAHVYLVDGVSNEERMGQAKANTHLITAAPELYWTLFNIVEQLQGRYGTLLNLDKDQPVLLEAEKLLKKARGEETK